MKNPFFGWNADTLVTTKGWFLDIEQTLAGLLKRSRSTKIEILDADFLLGRIEDVLSDSRGALLQLAEAQIEANQNAKGYAQSVGRALRAAG